MMKAETRPAAKSGGKPGFGKKIAGSWQNTWPALAFLALILILWEYGVKLFHVDHLFLPSISEIVRSMAETVGPDFKVARF